MHFVFDLVSDVPHRPDLLLSKSSVPTATLLVDTLRIQRSRMDGLQGAANTDCSSKPFSRHAERFKQSETETLGSDLRALLLDVRSLPRPPAARGEETGETLLQKQEPDVRENKSAKNGAKNCSVSQLT